MIPTSYAEIEDRLSKLSSGDFGGRESIRARSRQWYASYGTPLALYDGNRLHPVAESLAESRALDSHAVEWNEESAHIALDPVNETNQLELLSVDHAADIQLDAEVRERSEVTTLEANVEDRAKLSAALTDLLGNGGVLGADAFSYAKRVRLLPRTDIVGTTWTDLVGLSVYSQYTFDSARRGAESLLHEFLHTKSERLTRGFDRTFLDADDVEDIEIPWWRTKSSKKFWNTARAFDACYVYSHLSIFGASRFHRTGDDESLKSCRNSAFRARFLHHILVSAPEDKLDEQRREVAAWLNGIAIEPFDLSEGAKKILASPRDF